MFTLRLENFRCYENKIFTFPDEGLTLISGPSGIGKSTIMNAIFFALFDGGRGFKPQMFGKESCKVELEFRNLKITRQRRPNRLVLVDDKNKEYLDDEAQNKINELFGFDSEKPYEYFLSTCYLKQNGEKSFFLMKPTDKLEFLEKLAFRNINLTHLKNKCKQEIKSRNEKLISITSQLDLLSEQKITPPVKVPFPIKTQDKENALPKLEKNQKIYSKRIETLEKELSVLQKELTELKVAFTKLDNLQKQETKLKEQTKSLQFEINTTSYEGDEKLALLETDLNFLISHRQLLIMKEKYETDKERFEACCQEELESIKKEIENIDENLWKEYKQDEILSLITDYQQLLKDSDELARLCTLLDKCYVNEEKLSENKKVLEKARKKLEECKNNLSKLNMQKNLYECPACSATLRFENNELFENKGETKLDIENIDLEITKTNKEIFELSKTINRLEYSIPEETARLQRYKETEKNMNKIKSSYEGEIPNKDDLEANIENLQNYRRTQLELEKKMQTLENKLENKTFSSSLNSLKDHLASQKEKIKELEKKVKGQEIKNIQEEELRSNIETQRKNKEKIEDYNRRLKTLNREYALIFSELESIKKVVKNKQISITEEEIKTKESLLLETKEKNKKTLEQISKLQIYEKYKEEKKKYDDFQTKITDLENKEVEWRKKYSASSILLEKIKMAESIAISNIVESINAHAREYLDLFFPNDPITVQLSTIKQTKTGSEKPCINVQIQYKEMEANEDMLSGGELSRVVLAFTLALTEIFNTPLVLLDECTASLDQETTSVVMEGLKTHFSGKPVILIAHQVVTGEFDNRIEL